MVLMKALWVNNGLRFLAARASNLTTIQRTTISLHIAEPRPAGFGDDQGPCRFWIGGIAESKRAVGTGRTTGAIDQIMPRAKGPVVHLYSLGQSMRPKNGLRFIQGSVLVPVNVDQSAQPPVALTGTFCTRLTLTYDNMLIPPNGFRARIGQCASEGVDTGCKPVSCYRGFKNRYANTE